MNVKAVSHSPRLYSTEILNTITSCRYFATTTTMTNNRVVVVPRGCRVFRDISLRRRCVWSHVYRCLCRHTRRTVPTVSWSSPVTNFHQIALLLISDPIITLCSSHGYHATTQIRHRDPLRLQYRWQGKRRMFARVCSNQVAYDWRMLLVYDYEQQW